MKSRSGDDSGNDESTKTSTATTPTTTSVLDVYSPMERRKRPTKLTQDVDGAIRVTSMLRHMVNIGVATEESFQIVLEAVCGRGRLRWKNRAAFVVCAADEVEDLMQELWQRQDGIVSTKTCNLALRAYAACSTPRGDRRYAQKAQALLEDMEDNRIEPSIETYSHLVNAWAWQQGNLENGECAEKAQSNFEQLEKMNPDDATLLQALDWILEGWSKTRSKDAPPRAEEILNKMVQIKKKNPECGSSLPNSQSYANAILAWAKSRRKNSAEKAQEMLFQLFEKCEGDDLSLEPNIFAVSKFSSRATYSHGLLCLILDCSISPVCFHTQNKDGVISAWARIGKTEKAEGVLWRANEARKTCKSLVLDVVTYNSIVHGYLRDAHGDQGIQRMLQIVDYMNKNKGDQPSIAPDCFTYHCVLRAWKKSHEPDAAIHAVEALEKMHHLWESGDTSTPPKNVYYNMAINKLAKNKRGADARKALGVFRLLQSSKFCTPDIISYTSVIECLSKSNDPLAAEQSLDLFNEVWQLYQENEDEDLMPNLRTYTMAILSLTKNPTIENVVKARDLLSQLEDRSIETGDPSLKPNAYPYNYVLNCAASCVGNAGEKLKAFHIASQTYNDLRKSKDIEPDSYTYSFWIKGANSLLPEGELRRKCITLSFEQCQRDGLVNSSVLRRLLAGTPQDVLADLLDLDASTSPASYRQLTIEDLPPQWSRNTR